MTWQPIETAPKDGVALVYLTEEHLGSRIQVARWKDGRLLFIASVFAREVPERPTHWMPLPPPPTLEEPKP